LHMEFYIKLFQMLVKPGHAFFNILLNLYPSLKESCRWQSNAFIFLSPRDDRLSVKYLLGILAHGIPHQVTSNVGKTQACILQHSWW
jgi:hypothetical protein